MIDGVWPGVLDPTGAPLRADSAAHAAMIIDVQAAVQVLDNLADNPAVRSGLESRQAAEIAGEVLSRRGYAIATADVVMTSTESCDTTSLYVAERTDLGSFRYLGVAAHSQRGRDLGIGVIRDMAGSANDLRGAAQVSAATWFVEAGGAQRLKHFEWQLSSEEYAQIVAWLEAPNGMLPG